jgi:hypothetical protein
MRQDRMSVLIVLDTNAFYGDVYATKSWLNAVLDGAEQGDFEVVVPEVVIQELVKQFPKRLDAAVEAANTAVGRVARDLDRLDVVPPASTEVDRDALVGSYEAKLRGRLTGDGCRIEPHPADLQVAVDWSIQRRKPFKDGGEGFPDAAIWLTVLKLAAGADEVLIVSTNTEDFGDGSTPAVLAPELVSDLEARGLPGDRVRLITSVKTLVDEVVKPLAEADARAARLLADPDSRSRLADRLISALAYSPLPQDELRLGVELDNDPQPISLGFEEFELLSAREVGDGRLLLEIRALTDLLLDLTIFKADAYGIEPGSPISIVDPDWNDHYVAAEAEISAWLTLLVATDLEAEDLEVEVTGAKRQSDEEIVSRRLEAGASDRLLDALRNPPEPLELPVDSYLPDLPLQSTLDEARVESLGTGHVDLLSVDDVLDTGFACSLSVHVEGDVRWLVSAPLSFDADRYASLSEGEAGEGGWLSDVESSAPLVMLVGGVLTFAGDWEDILVEEVALEPKELERRLALPDPELDKLLERLQGR